MQPSGTSSRRPGGGPSRLGRVLIGTAVVVACAVPVEAKVFMTQEEALETAFPGGVPVERRTAYLTDEQAERIEQLAGRPPATKVVTYYRGGDRTACFDTHRVRTLAETIMIVVDGTGTIERIDILSFNEPEEYLPPDRWLRQLHGRGLDEELSLRGAIRPITGATLSGTAIVEAARRVLALHRVLAEAAGDEPETEP